ncbi:hypothetical protein GW944_01270 [Candidatus Parcubacteria bacterium]|nr:hypothetical protein [Candidatus Parcubacteria bacterium]
MKKYHILFFIAISIPTIAFAAVSTFLDLILATTSLINTLIPVAFVFALLFFMWGITKFIFKAGDESAKTEGKNIMIWGVIALFVISSIWGIVKFIQFSIFGNTGVDIILPPKDQMPPNPFQNV